MKGKYGAIINRVFDSNWLRCYQMTSGVVHGNVTEFTMWEFKILMETYGISPKSTTMKNPRANKIYNCGK